MAKTGKKNGTSKVIILIVSIFIIFISISYAFINQTMTGTKKQVIRAGDLGLEFEEGEEISLENALPMYDEVGMLQKPFTFKLVNSGKDETSYRIKLVQIDTENELALGDVRYCITKRGEGTPDFLSNIKNYTIDSGKVAGGETIEYTLRLWIRDDIKEEKQIVGKSLKLRIDMEAGQKIVQGGEIAFDSAEGVLDFEPNEVIVGLPYGKLPTPTREGYTFEGWYNSKNELITKETIAREDDGIISAKWNKNQYSLLIDPKDGTWEGSTAEQIMNLSFEETKKIADPTRFGYVFKGWKLDSKKSKIDNGIFQMGSENATLTAIWEIGIYQLTVNPNGGIYENKTSSTKINLEYQKNANIENPTREGYTFTGWQLNGAGSSLNEQTLTMGYEDASLTATWKANQYPWIVYYYQQTVDGTGYTLISADTGRGEAAFGSQVTPPLLTYQGFTAPPAHTIIIQTDNNPPVKNKVDYNYTRNRYTLNINPNGGNYNNSSNITSEEMYYGATKTIENPVRTGYTFNGWNISSGTLTDKNFTMGVENATLTANWKANTYSVNYHENGGVGSAKTDTATYGTDYYTLNNPGYTKTGHKFSGWNEKTDGTGSDWTGWIGRPWNWTYTRNVDLYAKWTPETYTVAYNANGGTGSMATDSIVYGNAYTTKSNSFSRTGYTFNGWNERADGAGVSWTNYVGVPWTWTYTKSITLYAQWQCVPTTIHFFTCCPNASCGCDGYERQTCTVYNNSVKYYENDSCTGEPINGKIMDESWDHKTFYRCN